jgi:hypothetical protein
MDQDRLRLLIRRKIQDGRLPLSVSKVQGSPSAGEKCDACEATLSLEQLLLEVTTSDGRYVQLHVHCHQVWDEERQAAPSRLG